MIDNSENVVVDVKNLTKGYYPIGKNEYNVYALKDININLYQGQRVGLIGRNGSGKSTFLKILSSLIKPSDGIVKIKGKVNTLIELGSNFIPDLSGRENVTFFLSMNGIKADEKKQIIEKIKEFSGLESYFDQPIKHYSSGMFVRLAISAGFHINADLFFIDEVLQTGDAAFREKVSEHFKNITNDGATLLLASHSADEIIENCTHCIWLDKGEVLMYDKASKVVEAYYKSLTKSYAENRYFPNKPIKGVDSWMSNQIDTSKGKFQNENIEVIAFSVEPRGVGGQITYDLGFKFHLNYLKKTEESAVHSMIIIYDVYMKPVLSLVSSNHKSTYDQLNQLKHKKGEIKLECEVPPNLITHGVFYAGLMFGKNPKKGELYTEEAYKLPVKIKFEVKQGKNYDYSGADQNVFVKPIVDWQVINNTIFS